MSDTRLNCRSPYFIEANTVFPTQPVIPDPVEPVENEPPTVTIVASNDNPYVGEEVTLTAVATDSDGIIVSYNWGGFASGSTDTVTINSLTLIDCQVVTVRVTDNDGATADDLMTICWQEKNELTTNKPFEIACEFGGGLYSNRGAAFAGIQPFSIDLGTKTGNFTIDIVQSALTEGGRYPIKYELNWDGNSVDTGYVGINTFDQELLDAGISAGDINTGDPSTNTTGTSLTINKTSASPAIVKGTITSPLGEGKYNIQSDCSSLTGGVPALTMSDTVEINLINDYGLSTRLPSFHQKLESARSEYIKDELINYYGNNTIYESRVTRSGTFQYRPFVPARTTPQVSGNTVVNFVFTNGSPLYFPSPLSPSTSYFNDLLGLRNVLDGAGSYGNHLVVFVCAEITTIYQRDWTETLDNLVPGISPYDGTNGLSDKPEVLFIRDFDAKDSPLQISQLVLDAMRTLGFLI